MSRQFLFASVTRSDRLIPTARRDRHSSLRALIAYSLTTSSAVMYCYFLVELDFTDQTIADVFVGHPIVRSSRVFDPFFRKIKEF